MRKSRRTWYIWDWCSACSVESVLLKPIFFVESVRALSRPLYLMHLTDLLTSHCKNSAGRKNRHCV